MEQFGISNRPGADGWGRTSTGLSPQRILSPLRLPFRHTGMHPGTRITTEFPRRQSKPHRPPRHDCASPASGTSSGRTRSPGDNVPPPLEIGSVPCTSRSLRVRTRERVVTSSTLFCAS